MIHTIAAWNRYRPSTSRIIAPALVHID